ncbi:MAG TPA: oligosaccharide flippase family protein [Thermoleophilaceae bacterium]
MPDQSAPAPDRAAIEERIALGDRSLREHTARGTIINAAFSVGLAGLGLLRQLIIAALLTASEFGLWGVIFFSATALIFLLDVGLSDKFVQQAERDQEAAFQKAFTINLVWRLGFFLISLATLPLFAELYGRPEIVVPGMVLSLAVIGSALQSPLWIFYREMRFARQRALHSIDPVVGLVVTAILGAAGAGYWSLIIGGVVGIWASGIVALVACPYPLRWRFERRLFGEYFSFSWPIVLASASGVAMVQLAIIVGEDTVGLAGIGAIGLAAQVGRFAERVDQIVTQTVYPAICAVRDRTDLLFEAFVKSNRLALMWGMPFGLALVLFAPDLVEYVFGAKWDIAVGLLQLFGAMAALSQIAFNWMAFFLATGNTKPLAVNLGLQLVTFAAVAVPLMFSDGLTGYGIGMACVLIVDLCVRAYFLTRLFSGFQMLRHTVRAIAPSVPAVAAVLAMRLVEGGGERTLGLAVAELVLYAAVTVVATWLTERALIREVLGYLRGRAKTPQPA